MTYQLKDVKKRNSELLDHYRDLYKKKPRSKYFVPLAEIYKSLDFFDEAKEVLQEGLKWHPRYFIARASLSQVYYEMGRFTEAGIEAKKVLDQTPNNLLALRVAMRCHIKLNENERAILIAKHFLKQSPEDVEAQKVIGMTPSQNTEQLSSPITQIQSRIEDFAVQRLAPLSTQPEHQKKINRLNRILEKIRLRNTLPQ
jgi:tetratricopeptide (TPR) repeat protein